jgi:hypothetical protein
VGPRCPALSVGPRPGGGAWAQPCGAASPACLGAAGPRRGPCSARAQPCRHRRGRLFATGVWLRCRLRALATGRGGAPLAWPPAAPPLAPSLPACPPPFTCLHAGPGARRAFVCAGRAPPSRLPLSNFPPHSDYDLAGRELHSDAALVNARGLQPPPKERPAHRGPPAAPRRRPTPAAFCSCCQGPAGAALGPALHWAGAGATGPFMRRAPPARLSPNDVPAAKCERPPGLPGPRAPHQTLLSPFLGQCCCRIPHAPTFPRA